MRSYNYILLDWDGNLAKTLDIWLWACREVMREFDIEITKDTIHQHFYTPVEYYTELGLPDPKGLEAKRVELAINRLPEAELYPDALEVLQHLKNAGKHLALITSSPRVVVDSALQRLELDKLFEVTITINDVERHKPDPEPFEKALTALGGNKAEAIMIGDAYVDIEGAKNFGVDSIAFMPPEHAFFYDFEAILEHQPTYAISDFRKIMEIIQ